MLPAPPSCPYYRHPNDATSLRLSDTLITDHRCSQTPRSSTISVSHTPRYSTISLSHPGLHHESLTHLDPPPSVSHPHPSPSVSLTPLSTIRSLSHTRSSTISLSPPSSTISLSHSPTSLSQVPATPPSSPGGADIEPAVDTRPAGHSVLRGGECREPAQGAVAWDPLLVGGPGETPGAHPLPGAHEEVWPPR